MKNFNVSQLLVSLVVAVFQIATQSSAYAGDNILGGRIEVRGDHSWSCGLFDYPEGRFVKVVAGSCHGAAIRSNGSVVCWGYQGSPVGAQTPMVAPSGLLLKDIASGCNHLIGLRTDNTVCWWGSMSRQVAGPTTGLYTKIASGWDHAAALRDDGRIIAWGYNAYSQCNCPTDLFIDVTAGFNTTVGLHSDGSVIKWGEDRHYTSSAPPEVPLVRLGESNWSSGCAVGWDASGHWYLWGIDGLTYGVANAPSSSTPFVEIVSGNGGYAFGRTDDGRLINWGLDNRWDQGTYSFDKSKRYQSVSWGNAVVALRIPCPNDLDGSDEVDSSDLGNLLLNIGQCDSCDADFDQNGEVNSADLGSLLLDFGSCP